MEKLDPKELENVTGAGFKFPNVTTLAIGEEGGSLNPNQPPIVSTRAFGEEDCGFVPVKPPTATTLAIGEEDGGGLTKIIEKITPFGQF